MIDRLGRNTYHFFAFWNSADHIYDHGDVPHIYEMVDNASYMGVVIGIKATACYSSASVRCML